MRQQYGKDWKTQFNKDQLTTYFPYRTAFSFTSDKEWNGTLARKQLDITAGATTTLDWDKHNFFNVSVGTDTTITLVNPRSNSDFVILLTKDNSASTRTITWDFVIDWEGSLPIESLTIASETRLVFFSYYGGLYRAKTSYITNFNIEPELYGAVGDGVTDDGPALQAAIDAAEAAGGGTVRLKADVYLSEQPLVIDDNHVWIEGKGHVFFQASPSSASLRAASGTRILAGNGVSNDSFVSFTSPVTGRRKVGGGLRSIVIDGQARAAVGVHVISRAFGTLDRVGVIYCKEDNILYDVNTDPQFKTVGGETACGTIYWRGIQVYCTNVNSANCNNANAFRTVGFENLLGVTADADATTLGNPNISQCTFHDSEFLSNNARGVFLTSANDFLFFNCKANSSLPEPWFMGCSEDDPRLQGHGAKKITLYGCNGDVLARASQTGRNSAKQIRLYAHEGLFDIPVTRETPAGGSPAPDVTVHTSEVGTVEKLDFVGYFTGEREKSTAGIYAETVDVTTTNGAASVTTSGLALTGRLMMGVTTRVVGAGAGAPPASYSVGIATDTDKYGTGLTWAANTTSGSPDYTDASFVPSQEIVITASTVFGGGLVRVTAYYFEATEIYES